MKQNKAGNDRGFSLVEMVIVIAILAVLTGVVAANYIKYYAQACVETDIANAREMAKKIDAAIVGKDGSSVQTTITGAGGTSVSGVEGLNALPYSKKEESAVWSITSSSKDGVIEITLGGFRIFPDDSSGNAYYKHYFP